MVCLGIVHPLGILPGEITKEAKRREHQGHSPKHRGGEKTGDDTVVFVREADSWSCVTVSWKEDHPDDHGSRDSDEGVFCPDVCHKRCFAKYRGQNSSVECRTPHPMAGNFAVILR